MKDALFKLEQLSNKGPLLLLIGGVNTKVRHWKPYIELLSSKYTIVCVYLSIEEQKMDTNSFKEGGIQEILKQIMSYNSATIDIISFSMGSLMALRLMEHENINIKNVLCIAPDGIKQHPVFYLATQTLLGKIIFRFLISNMKFLNILCKAGNFFKLIDAVFLRLTDKLKSDKEACINIYNYWIIYSNIKLNKLKINKRLNTCDTKLTFCFGKADVFIPVALSKTAQNLYPRAQVQVLDVGHYLKDNTYVNWAKHIFL